MNKRIVILVIAVLLLGIIALGYFLWQETNKLREAELGIVALEGKIAILHTNLRESEATASALKTKLVAANVEIAILERDITAFSEKLGRMRHPRHFKSVAELTDWLDKDDTDIKYADKHIVHRAFILQIRAVRDGYLLSTTVDPMGVYATNTAIIDDAIYTIEAGGDSFSLVGHIIPMPLHLIPPVK